MIGVQGSQWFLEAYIDSFEPRQSSNELVKSAETFKWFLEIFAKTSDDFDEELLSFMVLL